MKNKHAFQQQYTPVRFSHLMSYAGVGSIVRATNGKLMVVVDTRYWTDRNGQNASTPIPYVRRITKKLAPGKELRMPPKAAMDDNSPAPLPDSSYLPGVLFPKWAFCNSCGFLYPYPWRDLDNGDIRDSKCSNMQCRHPLRLEQVTWCTVSNQGHLDEVPWHYLAHLNTQNNHCKADYQQAYLKFTTDKRGKPLVKCGRCGSQGSYDRKVVKTINRQQPWILEPKPQLEEGDSVQVLPVNNPGVYIPERVNALVIPPESRIGKETLVDQLYNHSGNCRKLEEAGQQSTLKRKSCFKTLASEYRVTVAALESAWEEIKNGYPHIDDADLQGDLLNEEYKAFLTPLKNLREGEDFVTEHQTEGWKALLKGNLPSELKAVIRCVDSLVVAKRLREIQIFKGFHRLSTEDESGNKKDPLPPDIEGSEPWLPAIELFGEGVFFTLDTEWLTHWENLSAVKERAETVRDRYEKADIALFEDVEVVPRFLLLHTLAHLLIRELESSVGYPAAALHERIYCSRTDNMAGILIYTAVPDIAGSLGGIINAAEPKNFLGLLDAAFKHAQWCSLDPVCVEHEGQGPGWLNRAACHACVLVPEPACDYGNIFLDRTFIKGSRHKDGKELIPALPDFLDAM